MDIIKNMIDNNCPKIEIARVLNVKHETLNKHLKSLRIYYKGNPNQKGLTYNNSKASVYEYLNNNKMITASLLRNKLIESGLKEEKCECCGLTEWMGKKIPLELHHINMNHYDNRLENLQILCSNCHSLVHKYSNNKNKPKSKVNKELYNQILKNKKESIIPIEKDYNVEQFCKNCGKKLIKSQNSFCSQECYHKFISKKPEKDELVDNYKLLKGNKTKLGSLYGVSDNAVKKWLKYYEII